MEVNFNDFIFADRLSKPERYEEASNTVAYIGLALSTGALNSEAKWLIKRIIKVGLKGIEVDYASQEHDQIWDDRATLFPAIPFTPSLSTEFDGVNDYINFGDVHNYESTQAFSIAVWVNPNNVSAVRHIWGKATNDANVDGYMLRHNDDGKIYLQMRGTTANRLHTFDATLVAAQWQLLVFTFDGSGNINGASIYLDAVKDTSSITSGVIGMMLEPNQDFTLGSRNTAFYFSGKMFQKTVWSKELTQAEVTALYNSGVPMNPTTHSAETYLEAYLPLGDDDTFNIVSDNKNSIDGTMVNMTADDFVEDSP